MKTTQLYKKHNGENSSLDQISCSLYPMSASAVPRKIRPNKICVKMIKMSINCVYQAWSVVPKSQSITRFDCHTAVCLPYDIKECVWIHEATGEVWSITYIDTAVNKCRNRLHVCDCTINQHFNQFLLHAAEKRSNWIKCQQNVFCALLTLSNGTTLGKMQYFVGSDFPRWCKKKQWLRRETT